MHQWSADSREILVRDTRWVTTPTVIKLATAAGTIVAQTSGQAIDASALNRGIYIVRAIGAYGASRTAKMLNK